MQAISQARSLGGANDFEDQAAALRRLSQEWPSWRSYTLPVEDFTSDGFNGLLEWLGEQQCRFRRVVHTNEKGFTPDDKAMNMTMLAKAVAAPAAGIPLTGDCML